MKFPLDHAALLARRQLPGSSPPAQQQLHQLPARVARPGPSWQQRLLGGNKGVGRWVQAPAPSVTRSWSITATTAGNRGKRRVGG